MDRTPNARLGVCRLAQSNLVAFHAQRALLRGYIERETLHERGAGEGLL